jgi:precorrin-6Y C5,15-methyltransferase (decarboxylating)
MTGPPHDGPHHMTGPSVTVIGVPPDGGLNALAAPEQRALALADVVAAARRWLDGLPTGPASIEITGDLAAALDAIAAAHAAGNRVVVLAAGDPLYFGVGRALAERLGPSSLDVRPAPSSIAAAFGRIGVPWDDAVVVSAHGRPLADAVAAIGRTHKAAVLTSPENPPERIGAELARRRASFDRIIVASDLGMPSEALSEGPDADWLAGGSFPALSVVILLRGGGVSSTATLASGQGSRSSIAFGLGEDEYEHRDGMITKAEVRAVVIARLALPPSGVLWDVGAGSGSIGIEAALLAPGLDVFAIERSAEDAGRIRRNTAHHSAAVDVVEGSAPDVFATLPPPDRAVVGGGGIDVLDAVLERLNPAGRVVATFASLDRALAGADRLGALVQVSVSRGTRLPDGSLRLSSLDPVFVCWGPS